MDFQFSSTTDGRPLKIVSIISKHTRESLPGCSSAASPASTPSMNCTVSPAEGHRCPSVLQDDNSAEVACSAVGQFTKPAAVSAPVEK